VGLGDRVFVGNDPVNKVDPWGLITKYGKPHYEDGTPVPSSRENFDEWVKKWDDLSRRLDEEYGELWRMMETWDEEPSFDPNMSFSECIFDCMKRKLPNILVGVGAAVIFKVVLVETGVGALGVAAFETVSNSSTAIDVYNAYNQCKNEDCPCE